MGRNVSQVTTSMSPADLGGLSPEAIRAMIRSGAWSGSTAGLAPGFAQANLVVLPERYAYDFLVFCHRNPKPCPLIDVTEVGDPQPRWASSGADLRTDVPRYLIYRNGQSAGEVGDLIDLWRDDFVAFLLGCSFTFEAALLRSGLSVRHIEEGRNVPMYLTTLECRPAGAFRGPMVVSMRPLPAGQISRAIQITARYHLAHGAPVHVGNPESLGIQDLARPDYGDPVSIHPGEVPLFWACGVTPQAVVRNARPEVMITHTPGHMFITDLQDEDLALS